MIDSTFAARTVLALPRGRAGQLEVSRRGLGHGFIRGSVRYLAAWEKSSETKGEVCSEHLFHGTLRTPVRHPSTPHT